MIPVKIKPIDDEQEIVVNPVTGGVSYISSIEDYSSVTTAGDSAQVSGTGSAFGKGYLQNPAIQISRSADSGYIPNTSAMSADPASSTYSIRDLLTDFGILIDEGLSQAIDDLQNDSDFYEIFYAQVLNEVMKQKLVLTPEETLQLQVLATEGNYTELKAYLLAIAQKLTTGSYFMDRLRNDLKSKLLLSDEQLNQIETLFNQGLYADLRAYMNSLADNIENTYFSYYKIRSDLRGKLLLSNAQENKIIELFNQGKFDELRAYLKSVADSLKGNSNAEKLTRSILNQCAAMDNATLTKAMFEQVKMDPFDPSKDYGPWGEAIRRKWATTLSILRQGAKMDDATLRTAMFERITINIWDDSADYGPWGNAIRNRIKVAVSMLKQCAAMDDQTLLQVMFVKTATDYLVVKVGAIEAIKERIMWYLNLQRIMTMLVHAGMDSYNAVMQIMEQQTGYQKMNIEKLNTRQSESMGNYISTRKKEIYEYVNNHNERVKAEQEKQIQQQQNNEVLNFIFSLGLGIISFIVSLIAAIFTAGLAAPLVISSVATTVEIININRKAESDIAVKKKQQKIEEQLAMLRAAELKQEKDYIRKKIEQLEKLRKEAVNNKEYQELLDMEILANTRLLNSDAVLPTFNGFTQFNVNIYLRNSLRIQALAGYMRIYEAVKRAGRSSRNVVAEELALPSTSDTNYSQSVIAETTGALIERMTRKGNLEFQKAQLMSRVKEISEEIKKIDLTRGAQIITKVIFKLIDVFTFGLGSSALTNALIGTAPKIVEFLQQLNIAQQIVYSDVQPAYFFFRGNKKPGDPARKSDDLLEDIYSGILADTSQFSLDITPNKKMLNYTAYLVLLKKLERIYLMNTYQTAILKSVHTQRSMVHQSLTEVKARSADFSEAETAMKQSHELIKDIVQKQAYLTNMQITAVNQKIQAQNELISSGWSIATSIFGGLLGGISNAFASKGKKTEAFISNMFEFILNNEQGDLLQLLLPDSDLKIMIRDNPETLRGQLSNTEVDQLINEILTSNPYVTNSHGETIADLPAIAKKYLLAQRILIINQVLASLLAAKQKARDLVHMEMAEQASPGLELSKKQAAIAQQELQGQWDVLTEKIMSIAGLLSQKNVAQTQLQRNFLTSILSAILGSMAFINTGSTEISNSTAQLIKLSLTTGFLIQDMTDDTLDNYLVLSRKLVESENNVNEQLLLGKLEEQEEQLLLQAMAVKQNTGSFGLSSPNLSQLEHINFLLRKIKVLKDRIISIKKEELEDQGLVHGILSSITAELSLTAEDIVAGNQQYIEKLTGFIKKNALTKAQLNNSRQKQRINAVLSIMDNSLSAVYSVTPFLNEQYSENFNQFISAFQDILPSLQAGFLLGQLRSTTKAEELPDLTKLTPAEQDAVLAADLQEDTMLLEEAYPLLVTAQDLTQNAIKSLGRIVSRRINADHLYSKLAELVKENKLLSSRIERQDAEQLVKEKLRSVNQKYSSWLKLQEEYNKNLKLLQDQKVQNIFERKFNNGLSFYQNFNNYLVGTEQEAELVEMKLPQYAQALRSVREYLQAHQALLQDVVFIAGLHENRAGLAEVMRDYIDQVQLYGEKNGEDHRAIMIASSLYENFIRIEPQARLFLSDPQILAKVLNPDNALSLAITTALYSRVQNYKTVTQTEAEELAAYHGEFWRTMYNLEQKYAGGNAYEQDLSQSWAKFFSEGFNTREKYSKYGEDLDKDYRQACKDLSVIRELFNQAGASAKLDILLVDLSPEVKLHITEMAGNNVTYNAQLRAVIINYLENKVSGLEIKLLERQTDLDFAVNMLEEDWDEIKQIQKEYDRVCLEYEQTVRNNPNSLELAKLSASADELKKQLDFKEKKYKEKSDQYLKKLRSARLN